MESLQKANSPEERDSAAVAAESTMNNANNLPNNKDFTLPPMNTATRAQDTEFVNSAAMERQAASRGTCRAEDTYSNGCASSDSQTDDRTGSQMPRENAMVDDDGIQADEHTPGSTSDEEATRDPCARWQHGSACSEDHRQWAAVDRFSKIK